MPYKTIAIAKSAGFPTKAEDVPMTLAQVNKLASIYDSIKAKGKARNPMAVAWVQWKKLYRKEGDKWVTRKKESDFAEAMKLIESAVALVGGQVNSSELSDWLIQQVRVENPEANKARRSNKITLGEFFLPVKTSVSLLMSYCESVIDYLMEAAKQKDLRTEIPASIIQKAYDGVNCEIHRDGNKLIIYSDDGLDISERLPSLVEALKKLKPKQFIMIGELEAWKDKVHQESEIVVNHIHSEDVDDKNLVLNIHTLLWNEHGDLHKVEESARTKALNEIDFPQMTIGKPDVSKRLNLVPTSFVDTVGEAERAIKYFSESVAAKGAVVKFADMEYPLSGISTGILKDQLFAEALRFCLPHPSGKSRLAERIVKRFPKHKKYVEPFCGGAAVFFRKEKEGEEILNDLSPDYYFCLKFVQSISDSDIGKIEKLNWVASRSAWEHFKKMKSGGTDIEKFHRIIYLQKFSYGKKGIPGGFDPNSEGKDAPPKNLSQLKERLQGVTITNKDYKEVIKQYDSPDTFFYFDPPYPRSKVSKQLWENAIDEDEFEKTLSAIKGKWLLSYATTSRFKNFEKHTVSLPDFMKGGRTDGGPVRTEALISNYKIEDLAESATGKFVIQHCWGKEGLPVEHWDIRIDTGKPELLHMVLEDNLLENEEIGFYIKPCSDKTSMVKGKKIERMSSSKDTPAWISIIDSGAVTVLEDKETFKKFQFEGKEFKGLWTAERESAKIELWVLKQSK